MATRSTRPPARRQPSSRPRAAASAEPGTFAYLGETYRLDDQMGIWPIMQFARAAEAGLQITDQRGLAAMHAFLQDAIHPDDWGRFQDDMITKKIVDLESLMNAARKAIDNFMAAREAAEKAKAAKKAAPREDPQ